MGAGVWYENRNYFALFQLFQRCVKATYTDNGDGTIGVKNEAVRYLTGRANSITGTARPLDGTNAKLGLTFAGSPFSPPDAPYWVLGTDYTSYAIVWSCNSYGILNSRKYLTMSPFNESSHSSFQEDQFFFTN